MAAEDDEKIKWMYEGPKSLVNREEYLTGKKIDKNFELDSDVKEGLNIHVIRTEDPLVALKMKEENRKRQLLENPLIKRRLQKLLKQEFKATEDKAAKKHDKTAKKHEKPAKKNRSTTEKHRRIPSNLYKNDPIRGFLCEESIAHIAEL